MPQHNQAFSRHSLGAKWENWHETIPDKVTGPIRTAWIDEINPPSHNRTTYSANAVKTCTARIQQSIKDAQDAGIECRAVGRRWSLSDAPVTRGAMIDLWRLKGKRQIRKSQVDPGYIGGEDKRRTLCLIQAGNYISEINEWLEDDVRKLSMRVTGAANGQTIAGALSTGTHGSVLGMGAIHDQVVGLHIVTGPNPGDEVWLERASYPVLLPAVAQGYGANLVRDDDLFNAALIGLGAFGVIHNVVMETTPRYLLEAFNTDKDDADQRLILDAEMRARVGNLDFSATRLDPPGKSGTPHFYQPIINPNTNPPQVLQTHMYKVDWEDGYRPDYRIKEDTFGPGYDFVSIAGRVLNVAEFLVPLFANLVASSMFQLGNKKGSWGELFGYKVQRTKVASGTVAVDISDALDTLDALIELNAEIGPIPVVYGCRYIAKTQALLGFNKWDTTFVVSIDGLYNEDSVKLFDRLGGKMAQKGIEFTQHWGKSNLYDPARVRSLYGNSNVDTWIAARHTLMPDANVRRMFENDLIRRCGLDG